MKIQRGGHGPSLPPLPTPMEMASLYCREISVTSLLAEIRLRNSQNRSVLQFFFYKPCIKLPHFTPPSLWLGHLTFMAPIVIYINKRGYTPNYLAIKHKKDLETRSDLQGAQFTFQKSLALYNFHEIMSDFLQSSVKIKFFWSGKGVSLKKSLHFEATAHCKNCKSDIW